ncbi:hypothetical protein [Cupriavidus sp. CuC1]|uniref:hypothetical protein n=1 Tax=Cupriavidus sp. CuC1 TaxID=3373131 RepID=UPI0037D6A6D3
MSRRPEYANLAELEYYTRGLPLDALARKLRCTPDTARAWLTGARPAPWWTVPVVRLNHLESVELARQMGYAKALPRLGLVRGQVIELHRPKPSPAPVTENVTEMPAPGELRA